MWVSSFFFLLLKTKCPIFSQTHLIDLNVWEMCGKNKGCCCFPPLRVSSVFLLQGSCLYKLGSRYDLVKDAIKLKRAASNEATVQNKEWGPDDKNLEMWDSK